MTESSVYGGRWPVSHGAPPEAPLPIHGPEFSARPHDTYARLRAMGPIAPVEIGPGLRGYLTTTYRSALHLLRHTPDRFVKDPRHWTALNNGEVPQDCPALQMMLPRDNALWKDGPAHTRLRTAITGALARVNTHKFAAGVGRIADRLIDAFAEKGHADLVAQYADPLPMLAMIDEFGSPADIGQEITSAIASLFDTDQDAARANAELEAACLKLARIKRARPGEDLTSWLIQGGLSDPEMVQTIVLVFGAATTPSTNLIINGSRRILTDTRFSGSVYGGVQPVSAAVDEVLWDQSPVSSYSPLYPVGHQVFEGFTFVPGVPVLVGFAAANTDPLLQLRPGSRSGNRGHLAFSAGVHACPAPGLARILAETAIEHLLDRLPHLTLAVHPGQLIARPGTFHDGLTALPVTFGPEQHRTPTGR
ncbi:cytochrome P450 [Streptomyces sp. IB2014 016-6]|uniref:cytochrome P450 n=1 Tax=Streptomyces sp. IB2014 016-6 TaxID=2517818 RepID=UPI0011C75C88|nr:cytochrome P450 [Streptomyces sp. IB2014 016-6]TXL83955.1 cytochrome P450 [Streptomyces sp. IB2014 016-6]